MWSFWSNQENSQSSLLVQEVEGFLFSLKEKNVRVKKVLGSSTFVMTARVMPPQAQDCPTNASQDMVVKIIPRETRPMQTLGFNSEVMLMNLEKEVQRFGSSKNFLPFRQLELTPSAAFLFRAFIKHNLYDRMSTAPYLAPIEKRWIAFQLLSALTEMHSLGIYHGDIKLENVLVNSFLWVSLADPASYKPVFLSANHQSADFNNFFDISGRRTVCLAPERFNHGRTGELSLSPNDLTPQMDLFSLGCVLAELFSEQPLFNFSQYVVFLTEKTEKLPSISDVNVKKMIMTMLNIEPTKRKTAEQHINEQTGLIFPAYFHALRDIVGDFVITGRSADEAIVKLSRDFKHLVKSQSLRQEDFSEMRLILLPLLLSNLRQTRLAKNQLTAIEMLSDFAKFLDDSVVLDRIVPYFWFLLDPRNENNTRSGTVKSRVIFALHECLERIESIDLWHLDIFPLLVFPCLKSASKDRSHQVRMAVAQTISSFALISLRYIEAMFKFLKDSIKATGCNNNQQPCNLTLQLRDQYSRYRKLVTDIIESLLLQRQSYALHETFFRSDIAKLCQFFRQCSSVEFSTEFLQPFFMSLLNNGHGNWSVRAAFFDVFHTIMSSEDQVAKNWELVKIGLEDREPFVVYRALLSLARLEEAGILGEKQITSFMEDQRRRLLDSSSLWIRHGLVHFLHTFYSRRRQTRHKFMMAILLEPYLKNSMPIVSQPAEVLFQILKDRPRPLVEPPAKSQPKETITIASKICNNFDFPTYFPDFNTRCDPSRFSPDWTLELGTGGSSAPQALEAQTSLPGDQTEAGRYLDRNWMFYKDACVKQARSSNVNLAIRSSQSSNLVRVPELWQVRCRQVFHSDEHKRSIDRLSRTKSGHFFSTLSQAEQTIKVWSIDSLHTPKSAMSACVFSYDQKNHNVEASGAQFRPACSSFLNNNSLAILGDDFSFYLLDFASNRTRYSFSLFKNLFQTPFRTKYRPGLSYFYLNRRLTVPAATTQLKNNFPVEMTFVDEVCPSWPAAASSAHEYFCSSPARGLLVYSATNGDVSGIDMRCQSRAFELRRGLKSGYATAIITDPWYTWLALGTSSGSIEVFDFRFMLPVKKFEHPTRREITRLCAHPLANDKLVAAYRGNNEMRVWKMSEEESSSRPELVYWGVPKNLVPPLSLTHTYPAYMSGLVAVSVEKNPGAGLICASTDKTISYIDLVEPEHGSYLLSPVSDLGEGSKGQASVALRLRSEIVEKTNVLVVSESSPLFTSNEEVSDDLTHVRPFSEKFKKDDMETRREIKSFFASRKFDDAITDIAVCQPHKTFAISASRDGTLKIWR